MALTASVDILSLVAALGIGAVSCGRFGGTIDLRRSMRRYDQKLWNPELEGARGVPSHLTKG